MTDHPNLGRRPLDLADAQQLVVEMRHQMIANQVRLAYTAARLDAINMILFEAEHEWRETEYTAAERDLVRRLHQAQADVCRRRESEYPEEMAW